MTSLNLRKFVLVPIMVLGLALPQAGLAFVAGLTPDDTSASNYDTSNMSDEEFDAFVDSLSSLADNAAASAADSDTGYYEAAEDFRLEIESSQRALTVDEEVTVATTAYNNKTADSLLEFVWQIERRRSGANGKVQACFNLGRDEGLGRNTLTFGPSEIASRCGGIDPGDALAVRVWAYDRRDQDEVEAYGQVNLLIGGRLSLSVISPEDGEPVLGDLVTVRAALLGQDISRFRFRWFLDEEPLSVSALLLNTSKTGQTGDQGTVTFPISSREGHLVTLQVFESSAALASGEPYAQAELAVETAYPRVGPLSAPEKIAPGSEIKVTAAPARHFNPGQNLEYAWLVNGEKQEGAGVSRESLVFTPDSRVGDTYRIEFIIRDLDKNPVTGEYDQAATAVQVKVVDYETLGQDPAQAGLAAAVWNFFPPAMVTGFKILAVVLVIIGVMIAGARLPEWLARQTSK